MITFKAVILPSGRRRDGTYPVKIRVTFKGVSRRLPTTLSCFDADLTRARRLKNPTILQKAGEIIAQMREAVSGLSPFTLEGWNVDDVVQHIKDTLSAEKFQLDFFAFARDYIDAKKISESTRSGYLVALGAFSRYLGRKYIDINDISRKMVMEFVERLSREPKVSAVARRYVKNDQPKREWTAIDYAGKLAHIFTGAKAKYNDEDAGRFLIPRSPFSGIKRPKYIGHGQECLEVEVMQRIIDAKPASRKEADALHIFLLSFALQGANMADLYAARNVSGEVWKYNRQKTAANRIDKAEIRVYITEEARALLRALSSQRRGDWIPSIHQWQEKDTATTMTNYRLKQWAEREGVQPFTFYAARHTWATLARRIGVEKATVDEAIGHVGDFRMADIYAERNWSLSWEANKKVLALFRWDSLTREE